jgi:hypothetical protein
MIQMDVLDVDLFLAIQMVGRQDQAIQDMAQAIQRGRQLGKKKTAQSLDMQWNGQGQLDAKTDMESGAGQEHKKQQ